MILDEETYLEHFGVKGMRWGQRKSGGASGQGKSGRSKFKRNLAVSAGVGIAGGLAVGAILKRNKNVKMAQIRRINETKANFQKMSEVFRATSPKGTNLYGKHAGQAFRKAGAFEMGPIGSTGVARIRGAIPLPKVGG